MNKNTGLIYKPEKLRSGYLSVRVGLSHKERIHVILHKAVALTFIENPLNLRCVNHKGGIKQNNAVENLEWCSASDNLIHAYSHQLFDVAKISGENNHNAKLTTKDVMSIRKEYQKGSRKSGGRALARKYNVSKSVINDVVSEKTWKYY